MNREEFLEYLSQCFSISGEAMRLIGNILDYAQTQDWNPNEQHRFLCRMLDGTIGLSENEIRNIKL